MKLLTYAFRELKNNRRFCVLFILNLSLGLTGLLALDGFKESIDRTIRGRSKAVLGADFGISARRPMTKTERSTVQEHLPSDYSASQVTEVFSMVASQSKQSRLVQIKAVEKNYPFYGEIELEKQGRLDSKVFKKSSTPRVWVYPELIQQLKVNIGDRLIIGSQSFVIDDVVTADSAAGISTNMAPRIYMDRDHLAATKLVKKGSVAWHSTLFAFPGKTSEQLKEMRKVIFEDLTSPSLRVFTHEDESEQMSTLISRLNDFLGLASLVALFLAAVGLVFLFRAYFKEKISEVAILICLGAPRRQAYAFYLTQIVFLGIISSILATFLSLLIVPGLGNITREFLPFEIEFGLSFSTVLVGLGIATFGSLLICLPVLQGLKDLRPSMLLVEQKNQGVTWSFGAVISSLPILLLFWGLAMWLSHSYKVGSLFTGLFLLSSLVLAGGSIVFFAILPRLFRGVSLSLKWALRDLSRKKMTTTVCFISIGLGALLLNLIPQIEKSIGAELERPEQSRLPSLFMFDIQEEQVEDFKTTLASQKVKLDQISPMIRARLEQVNDKSFDKGVGASSDNLTREEQREMRFRNRGFNLTYREKLSEAETVVEGRAIKGFWNEDSEELPAISVEQRFASRLNLSIGDKLTFNIESIPVVGRVVNLRKIKWTSFQPNFFVQFQPGVLEIAPKTFVATVSGLNAEEKIELQNALVEKLPNVAMVDISKVVERISGIMDQMSWALIFMSLLCLFAGFVVIYSIANHQVTAQKWDIGLLKALGADFSTIRGQFLWQYCCIAFVATVTGALISLLVSFILSSYLFDSLWVFDWKTPLFSIVGATLITYAVTDLATRKALKTRTLDLFSA